MGSFHSMMHRLAVERAHAQAEGFRPAAHLGVASKAPDAQSQHACVLTRHSRPLQHLTWGSSTVARHGAAASRHHTAIRALVIVGEGAGE